ncbi:hypothetical protein B4N84_07930 [Flavobacterium sp. IR1]|nr:hypothetical protein B4N84_07930 [Flavobacterium sp. IR1]
MRHGCATKFLGVFINMKNGIKEKPFRSLDLEGLPAFLTSFENFEILFFLCFRVFAQKQTPIKY